MNAKIPRVSAPRTKAALLGLAVLLVAGVTARASSSALTNELQNHPSPYLALHSQDPVAWQVWDEHALAAARRENKLLFLSIGYFACHWCHVMQRESYRDPAIAAFVNAHFIPVKIDRELDPALDARLLAFARATRGAAGWPLNVFLTPQGAPVFAALYQPPAEFQATLVRLRNRWVQDAAALSALAQQALPEPLPPAPPQIARADVERRSGQTVAAALSRADSLHGGFGEQSKFPVVPLLSFLLAQQARTPQPELEEILRLTLDEMAGQGLHDHLNGGFFRYATDPAWTMPHFEKMLHDNALLARLYLHAGRVLAEPAYTMVARRTLDFLLATFAQADGGMIASLSATDAQGEEGGYYLWSDAELVRLLTPDEARAFRLAWRMQDAPAFAAGHLPLPGLSLAEIAEEMQAPPVQVAQWLAQATRKLRAAQQERGLPRDEKRLAAWNGLALQAFAEAAQQTGDGHYRQAAQSLRQYLVIQLWDGARLRRAVIDGREAGRAALEDYAYVAAGLLAWAELTRKQADYRLARTVAAQGWKRFYRDGGWHLGEHDLLAGGGALAALPDGPTPAPSTTLAQVSLRVARVLGDRPLRERALSALNAAGTAVDADPLAHASYVAAAQTADE